MTSITITVTYMDATVWYCNNGTWQQCVVLQRWNMDSVRSVLQQWGQLDQGIIYERRNAFELGTDCRDGAEILGAAGVCAGSCYYHMVVQAADEEAEGECH